MCVSVISLMFLYALLYCFFQYSYVLLHIVDAPLIIVCSYNHTAYVFVVNAPVCSVVIWLISYMFCHIMRLYALLACLCCQIACCFYQFPYSLMPCLMFLNTVNSFHLPFRLRYIAKPEFCVLTFHTLHISCSTPLIRWQSTMCQENMPCCITLPLLVLLTLRQQWWRCYIAWDELVCICMWLLYWKSLSLYVYSYCTESALFVGMIERCLYVNVLCEMSAHCWFVLLCRVNLILILGNISLALLTNPYPLGKCCKV